MELHLAWRSGQDRGLNLGMRFVNRRGALVRHGFADHGNFQLACSDALLRNKSTQARQALLFEHCRQLVGRAGQQHNDRISIGIVDVQKLSRR